MTLLIEQSGYRTQSILAAPLVTSNNKTVGVMQIINPLNDDRQPVSLYPWRPAAAQATLPITPPPPLNAP